MHKICDLNILLIITKLNVTVKEQYLNNTLHIQCGLCGCLDALSEDISYPSVKLVTFG